MARPKCGIKKCKNDAIILVAGKWVCGDCCVKAIDKQNKSFWK